MNRPFIEAAALLASQGFDAAGIAQPAPQIAPGIPFAILETPQRERALPRAYPDIRRLARWVHRRRRGRPIQLETKRLLTRDGMTRRGVSVWIDGEGEPRQFLGWCWLSGQSRMALHDALTAFDRKETAR